MMRMGLKENKDSTNKLMKGKENDERRKKKLDRGRNAQEHMNEEGIARKMTPTKKV